MNDTQLNEAKCLEGNVCGDLVCISFIARRESPGSAILSLLWKTCVMYILFARSGME